jgi:hypothetical protein
MYFKFTDSIEDFKSLAHLLRDVLNHRDINLPEEQRQLIELGSEIMTDVAKFLVTMNKSLEKFETICNDGMFKNVTVYTSLGDIIKSLSALFDVLGLEEKSNNLKKQGNFLKKIFVSLKFAFTSFHHISFQDSLSNIDEINSLLECGAYGKLALTLDDLADIVQSVGIEALSKKLGVDLDFIADIIKDI